MPANHCHHIKEDGVFCESPALSGRRHCYFHLRPLDRNMKFTRPGVGEANRARREVWQPLSLMA